MLYHTKPEPKPLTREEKLELVKSLASQGKTRKEISKEVGYSPDYISELFGRNGIDYPHKHKQKLPDTELGRVAAMVASGLMQREIAEVYDCNQSLVSKFMVRHGLATSNGRGRREYNYTNG